MDREQDLEQRVAALERRLRAAEDHQAIANLKSRYGQLADRRYAGGHPATAKELEALGHEISLLFTEDGVWDGGAGLGLCEGRAAIAERMAKPTLEFSWHYFVKPRIQVEGDQAEATWDILAPCTMPGGKPHWMAGVEHDRYRRVDGEWLHERMTLEVVFLCPYEGGWAQKPRPS